MNEQENHQLPVGRIGGDWFRCATIAGLLAEILFVFLPLLVISLVLIAKGSTVSELFSSPEWSFATTILIGQSIIKLVAGAIHIGGNQWQRVALAVATMIVLGLVPSLIVLALVLTAPPPPFILVEIQIGLFWFAVFIFFVFGGRGARMLEH